MQDVFDSFIFVPEFAPDGIRIDSSSNSVCSPPSTSSNTPAYSSSPLFLPHGHGHDFSQSDELALFGNIPLLTAFDLSVLLMGSYNPFLTPGVLQVATAGAEVQSPLSDCMPATLAPLPPPGSLLPTQQQSPPRRSPRLSYTTERLDVVQAASAAQKCGSQAQQEQQPITPTCNRKQNKKPAASRRSSTPTHAPPQAMPATPTKTPSRRTRRSDSSNSNNSNNNINNNNNADQSNDNNLPPTPKRSRRHADRHQPPYCCPKEDCRQVLATNSHLARHMRVHTGLRPYKCLVDGCDKTFARQDNMRQHYRSHEKKAKDGPKESVQATSIFDDRNEAIGFWRVARRVVGGTEKAIEEPSET